jgi:hypothetical protein
VCGVVWGEQMPACIEEVALQACNALCLCLVWPVVANGWLLLCGAVTAGKRKPSALLACV